MTTEKKKSGTVNVEKDTCPYPNLDCEECLFEDMVYYDEIALITSHWSLEVENGTVLK